jgi:hypothetical protein
MWCVKSDETVFAVEATNEKVALPVYPTLMKYFITVSFEVDLPKTVEIGIFDNLGRERIKFWKTYQKAGTKQEILSLNGLLNGAYIIRLNNHAARIVSD